jgi:hypothetical protein
MREYNGSNENEKIFLEGLFRYSNCIKSSDLQDKFYLYLKKIKQNLKKENKHKIFVPSKKTFFVFLMIIIAFLLVIKPIVELGEPIILTFSILFPLIGLSVLLAL